MSQTAKPIPNDLLLAIQLVFNKCAVTCSTPIPEDESIEYGAYTFTLDNMAIRFRVAKITPTKMGQFVTLWKRNTIGTIEPFTFFDSVDFYIISCRKENQFGQFIFPKNILHTRGVLSDNNKEGKRAMRVYPPWDIALNKQAKQTQQWQLPYFTTIQTNNSTDLQFAKNLLSKRSSI